jgi:glyoxylase I family protein
MSIDVRGMAPLLQVFDMAKSMAFYRDVIGFEIVNTNTPKPPFDWVLLKLGDVELMLNTAFENHQRPTAFDPARVKGHGDTGLYFGCPDVDAAFEQLRAHGVQVEKPRIAPYGMKQLDVIDPDGYQLTFQWPATL